MYAGGAFGPRGRTAAAMLAIALVLSAAFLVVPAAASKAGVHAAAPAWRLPLFGAVLLPHSSAHACLLTHAHVCRLRIRPSHADLPGASCATTPCPAGTTCNAAAGTCCFASAAAGCCAPQEVCGTSWWVMRPRAPPLGVTRESRNRNSGRAAREASAAAPCAAQADQQLGARCSAKRRPKPPRPHVHPQLPRAPPLLWQPVHPA